MMLQKVNFISVWIRATVRILISLLLFVSATAGNATEFQRSVAEGESASTFPALLSEQLSDKELMEARIFSEPLVPMGEGKTQADTEDRPGLIKVLNAYRQSGSVEDRLAIEAYLDANPESRWRASLLANLGREHYQAGYFSKALAAWEKAWELGKRATEPKAKATMDWAIGEAAALNAKLGRFGRLKEIFQEIGDRSFTGPATELISGARQGLWLMEQEPGLAFRCGPMALDRIRTFQNPKESFDQRLLDSRSTKQGMSLAEVHNLAESLSMGYQMAKREQQGAPLILPCVVHWKLGHFGSLLEEVGGKYRMEDPTFKAVLHISRAAIDEESSGYFLVPHGKLPPGWKAVSVQEANEVWGKGYVGGQDPDDCKPTDRKIGHTEGNSCKGMAQYDVHLMLVSLNIVDTPVGYDPPRGPSIPFTATYNQREVNQPSLFTYTNFGPKWTCNWISFVVDNPWNPAGNVSIYVEGGGSEPYTKYNEATRAFGLQIESQAKLIRTSSSSYEKHEANGWIKVYDLAEGTNTGRRRVFLTKVVDSAGHAVKLTYDSQYRLTTITDAIGQVTRISYELDRDPLKVTQVTDPFGRSARFEYNTRGQLLRIIDVAGLKSEFAYEKNDFINALVTPYGKTCFVTGEEGGVRWVEIEDPQSAKERVEFRENAPGIGEGEPQIPSRHTLNNTAIGDGNIAIASGWQKARNTFYWDREAMAHGAGDYTKAHIFHWLHAPDFYASDGVLESEKKPLESRIYYNYQGQANPISRGTTALVSKQARLLEKDITQIYQYAYNENGYATRVIDPVGRQTRYTYWPNERDLKEVRQQNGATEELLASYTYNDRHQVLTQTDAAEQTTKYTYTAEGQLASVTNPKGETTSFAYDSKGFLQSIQGPAAGAKAQFSYDAVGRLASYTDADGVTVRFDYDVLDRLRRITYSDGTYEENIYERLNLQKHRDRQGRWTLMRYNAMRQPIFIQDSSGQGLNLVWCRCGALKQLVDANQHRTSWNRDLQGRVISKVYADGSKIEYQYDLTSRLKARKDAAGQEMQFAYYQDDRLKEIAFQNARIPTSGVSFLYDAAYPRISKMIDGTGTTVFTYHPIIGQPSVGAGQLQAIDGPQADDTITYSYDVLGRVVGRVLGGSRTQLEYDGLGRLQREVNSLGSFEYGYEGVSKRLARMEYPNGRGESLFKYFGAEASEKRGLLKEILHRASTDKMLSKYGYDYDAGMQVNRWEVAQAEAQKWELGYNAARELERAQRQNQSGSIVEDFLWHYDVAGNRLSEQHDGNVINAGYNALNQLVQLGGAGSTLIEGLLNMPSRVWINNLPASIQSVPGSEQYRFSRDIDVTEGRNEIEIRAQNGAGIETKKRWAFEIEGISSQFKYDANGNLLSDGRREFHWDAKNRLESVKTPDGTFSWEYDGLDRRVLEKKDGAVTKRWIWDGLEMIQERDAAGKVTKNFFHNGLQAEDKSYVYTRDHLGSVREVVNLEGVVEARYDYSLWGARKKLSGSVDVPWGFTGHYHHEGSGLVLAPYRTYAPELGRWISRDPIEEKGGLNLYGYVGNDPVGAIDPDGLDVIYLNDQEGASGYGHAAVLVGDDSEGWVYFSKDGYQLDKGHINVMKPFSSFDVFDLDAVSQRYERGIRITTSRTQDIEMIKFGRNNYGANYNMLTNNCGDLARDILKVGDILILNEDFFGITIPNKQYDFLEKELVGKQLIMQ